MPRRKTDIRVDDDAPDRMPDVPGDEAVAPDAHGILADKEIEELLGEIGSSARVRIQRVNPETGVPAHVGEIPADGFSLETLADTYGGGRYVLRIMVGREQRGGRFIQEIDSTIPPRNPRAPRGSVGQIPGGSSGLANDAMLAIVTGAAQSNQQSMQMVTQMMGAVTAAITAMMSAGRNDRDPLDYALKIAELTRSGQVTPKTSTEELLALLELTEKVRGMGSSGDTSELDLIKEGISTVKEIVQRVPQQQPHRIPPNATAVPSGTPTVAVTPLPANPPSEIPATVRAWTAAIAPQLPQLRAFAGSISPATVADIVSEKLSEEAWGDLVADIATDMPVGSPITIESCTPFARRAIQVLQLSPDRLEWVAELAKEILEIANEDVDEPEPETPKEETTDAAKI